MKDYEAKVIKPKEKKELIAKKDFRCNIDVGYNKPKILLNLKKGDKISSDAPSKILDNLKTEGVI